MNNIKINLLNILKNHKNRIIISIICCSILVATLSGLTYATKNVTIIDQDNQNKIFTLSNDPYEILKKEKINLGENDKIEVLDMDSKYPTIKILRAFDIFVKADNQTHTIKDVDLTVKDVLEKLNLTLNENDIINFELNQKVSPNDEIIINRVTFEQRVENSVIDYNIQTKNSGDMLVGETKVETEGQEGNIETIYQDKYIDGVLVETLTVSENTTKDAVDKIVLQGTKKPSNSSITAGSAGVLNANGVPMNYRKVFNGKATAYTAGSGAKTASGRPAMVGHVAVDPRIIPYGTKLYIASPDGKFVYGYAIAADTGGALMSGNVLVDLYFDTYGECIQFGAKNVNVYVID